MIITTNTPFYAGIELWGDYFDLKSLHSTINQLTNNSQLNDDIKETILGLAYDVRKAYGKQRKEEIFGYDYASATYRGAEILWPVILFQVNALRNFAKYQPTNKEQQANLYRLEYCLEKSLLEIDEKIGKECVDWLKNSNALSNNYYAIFLCEVSKNYTKNNTKKRFKELPRLLRELEYTSEEYQNFAKYLETKAKQPNCEPQDFFDFSESDDFKW